MWFRFRRTWWIAVALSFTLADGGLPGALAQTPDSPPPKAADPCNAVGAAALGALAGALLAGRNHRLAGAAVGGGLGAAACLAYNYHSQQVKTSDQVAADFEAHHHGQLPVQATVARYETKFDPSNQIKPGTGANLNSFIEIVPGSDGVAPVLEEEINMYGPDGKLLRTAKKPANTNGQAGDYQTQFSFKLPEGVPQGVYAFKTSLYLNGQKVQDGGADLQVVSLDLARPLASR
jgi:hypothetical protein